MHTYVHTLNTKGKERERIDIHRIFIKGLVNLGDFQLRTMDDELDLEILICRGKNSA